VSLKKPSENSAMPPRPEKFKANGKQGNQQEGSSNLLFAFPPIFADHSCVVVGEG